MVFVKPHTSIATTSIKDEFGWFCFIVHCKLLPADEPKLKFRLNIVVKSSFSEGKIRESKTTILRTS
jgi:hypothetical protein